MQKFFTDNFCQTISVKFQKLLILIYACESGKPWYMYIDVDERRSFSGILQYEK